MYANQIQAQQEEISTLLENNGEYLSEISQLQSKTREIKNELNSIENFKSLIYEKINNSTFPNPSPKNSPISFNVSSIDLEMPKGGGITSTLMKWPMN
ncbi:MAG: hypothetical protein GX308_00390 [Epulopiscium sp.]|nr:hypothetical protein [Candidatus Epulonipiscium sp.]